ncbi:MAG: hypothetical protein V6Z86_03910 [Hyphomicrobiales bacterium]
MLAEQYVTPRMWGILKQSLPERSDEEFRLQVEEFLKFMVIVSTEGASFIPLGKEVDEVWHEFIWTPPNTSSLDVSNEKMGFRETKLT